MRLRLGLRGWSYADWKGVVYPGGKVDELAYIGRYVDVIEINSSFYRPPVVRNSESWLKRTADLAGLRFTGKVASGCDAWGGK